MAADVEYDDEQNYTKEDEDKKNEIDDEKEKKLKIKGPGMVHGRGQPQE